jgi:hypothetical protein
MKYSGAFLGAAFVVVTSFSGCSSDDPVTGRQPRCGNGYLEEEELCDSMEIYCSDDCMSEIGRCGDGIVQEEFGEMCDPVVLGAGGAGGVGGAGGSSSAQEEVVGCSDQCLPKGGFVCDPGENTCGQTGLDAAELVSDHIPEVCEYYIALWGGAGSRFSCELPDGLYNNYVAGEVGECVEDFVAEEGCTIGEFESWARGKTRCEIATGQAPCFEQPEQ